MENEFNPPSPSVLQAPPLVPPAMPAPESKINFSLTGPGMERLLVPLDGSGTRVNDAKVRRLYLQASQQQWFGPQRVNFEEEIVLTPEERRVWIKLTQIFYTLEKMGLDVISRMTAPAVARMKSSDVGYYLAVQGNDEARHVFLLENYLRVLGQEPKYDRVLHVLNVLASHGYNRVENWLFSTLFSENFAHSFLRRAKNAQIDSIGASICRNLQLDESRHLHFLHIVLPDLYDRMGFFGKGYLKVSQYFIMKFTEVISRSIAADAAIVGIERRDLLEEVFANVERSYASFGVNPNFLPFPKIDLNTPTRTTH
jgi:hypothetical protein